VSPDTAASAKAALVAAGVVFLESDRVIEEKRSA
jgi:hypothetical protein